MTTHGKKPKYRCTGYPPCEEVFRKQTQLERHRRVAHYGLGAFVCKHILEVGDSEEGHGAGSICRECFVTRHRLQSHMKKKHGRGNNPVGADGVAGGVVSSETERGSSTTLLEEEGGPTKRVKITNDTDSWCKAVSGNVIDQSQHQSGHASGVEEFVDCGDPSPVTALVGHSSDWDWFATPGMGDLGDDHSQHYLSASDTYWLYGSQEDTSWVYGL